MSENKPADPSRKKGTEDLYWFNPMRTRVPIAIACLCIFFSLSLVGYKLFGLDYKVAHLEDKASWLVRTSLVVAGKKKTLVVRAMMPLEKTARQQVSDLNLLGAGFDITKEDGFAVWRKSNFTGLSRMMMTFRAQTKPYRVSIPVGLPWDEVEVVAITDEDSDDPHGRIGAFHAQIQAEGERLRSSTLDVAGFLKALYDFIHKDVKYVKVGGPTDALTCLQLREGSCNGKNRLLVAIARSQGLQARMCKGLIMEDGKVTTVSHAWSEVLLNGQWIPFCPTNGYFARIPEHYLEFPKVDQGMFSYTKNVKLKRAFTISKGRITPEQAFRRDLDNPRHILHAWGSLDESDFSLSLLMIILTIPVGVTMVCFLRSIVGLLPFGTFLPALIAVSFRDTGLLYGIFQFLLVILICVGINEILKKFYILHYPRISIVFCCVVISILTLAVITNRAGIHQAAKVGMFPLAILTLTVERFSMMREMDSVKTAIRRLFFTILCAALCYVPMMDFQIQSYMLLFPELILFCIGLNMLMGLYTHLKLVERFRFRNLFSVREVYEK